MLAHRANVARNGHCIIVYNNNKRQAALPRIVQRLKAHAAGKRAVAYNGNNAPVVAQYFVRPQYAYRCGYGRARMARFKRVANAFRTLGEAAYAALFPQCVKLICAAGKYFMHICLMPNIEYYPVNRGIERAVKRHCQLHHAKVRRQMPAVFRYFFNQKRAYFRRQPPQFLCGQCAVIIARMYFIYNGVIRHSPSAFQFSSISF